MTTNTSKAVPPVDLALLRSFFAHMSRIGMPYGLGAKIPLDTKVDDLKPGTKVDCSGFVQYILRQSSGIKDFPDGSQVQREWAENNLRQIAKYSDCNTYLTNNRLFIAFIKPWENGCRAVGHVWLVGQFDSDTAAETMESHGGVGVHSRPWNTSVLVEQVYSVFELPTK